MLPSAAFHDHLRTPTHAVALEIVEDLPDVDAVAVPYGGGALSCGIASLMNSIRPQCKVFACEPETAAPLTKSFREGKLCSVDYIATFVDGCGGMSVLERMWPLAEESLAGAVAVPLADVALAVRLMAERNKVISEGAGGCPVAAAMQGKAGKGKVVCVVSGGGIDTKKLVEILSGWPHAADPSPRVSAGSTRRTRFPVLQFSLGVLVVGLMAAADSRRVCRL